VFGWPRETADLERFFPTSVLETGHDILFFWFVTDYVVVVVVVVFVVDGSLHIGLLEWL
jgi:valyl-tRNA synthetase